MEDNPLKVESHGTKVSCQKSLTISFSTPVMYIITILGVLPNKLCTKIRIKTNTGKRMVSFAAIDLWQEIPQNFKDLNPFSFSKSTKNYLLIQQHQT